MVKTLVVFKKCVAGSSLPPPHIFFDNALLLISKAGKIR